MTKVIETFPEVEELIKTFKKETVAEESLRKLEQIPEELSHVGSYTSQCGKKHCGLWWLGYRENIDGHHKPAKDASLYLKSQGIQENLSGVNDGYTGRYNQPTPKQRVIALLQDMIKAGY